MQSASQGISTHFGASVKILEKKKARETRKTVDTMSTSATAAAAAAACRSDQKDLPEKKYPY